MTDPAFDYRRYRSPLPPKLRPPVHQRPQLAWSQPAVPPRPDELSELTSVIRNSTALITHSLRLICGVLWRRGLVWVEAHFLQSLTSAWATAGIGWGGCIAFCAVQIFTR